MFVMPGWQRNLRRSIPGSPAALPDWRPAALVVPVAALVAMPASTVAALAAVVVAPAGWRRLPAAGPAERPGSPPAIAAGPAAAFVAVPRVPGSLPVAPLAGLLKLSALRRWLPDRPMPGCRQDLLLSGL